MTFAQSKFPRSLLIALLATALCRSAHAQQSPEVAPPSSPSDHALGRKLSIDGLPNLGQISPYLFRGAQPSREGLQALANMNIAIVVDLKGDRDSEREEVTRLGMQYVSIPSRCSHMSDDGIAKFLSILRDNPDKKIFVHCQFGVDRTGMMIAAYRMSEQGWSVEESLREMEAFGFSKKHKMMCPGLASFAAGFPNAFANDSAFENLRPAASPAASKQQAPAGTKQ